MIMIMNTNKARPSPLLSLRRVNAAGTCEAYDNIKEEELMVEHCH